MSTLNSTLKVSITDDASAAANAAASAIRATNPWSWWAGENDEWFVVGPCATREEAIERAKAISLGASYDEARPGYTIHVIEARQDPIRLADWIDVDAMVENLHERLGDDLGGEDGESPAYGAWNDEQSADLETALHAAVAAWQKRHGIVVRPRQFTNSRNAERISTRAPEPAPAEAPAVEEAL